MQKKRSKRYQCADKLVSVKRSYALIEAISLLKGLPPTKFNQTISLSFNLGIDPKRSDHMVRGTCLLPHGSGRSVRVLVFATGKEAVDARGAGAEYVGYEDLLKKVGAGFFDFDVVIATPLAMVEVRKLGKILGPRGLMPNPKAGTVTENTAAAVKEIKSGRIEFKLDKNANISVPIGKFSFLEDSLAENGRAVINTLLKARPITAKGTFIKTITLSATMSPGLSIDSSCLSEKLIL